MRQSPQVQRLQGYPPLQMQAKGERHLASYETQGNAGACSNQLMPCSQFAHLYLGMSKHNTSIVPSPASAPLTSSHQHLIFSPFTGRHSCTKELFLSFLPNAPPIAISDWSPGLLSWDILKRRWFAISRYCYLYSHFHNSQDFPANSPTSHLTKPAEEMGRLHM